MKNSARFFIQYYLKKHLGFLWGASVSATDIFWKNFYRLRAAATVEVLEQSNEKMILQSTVGDKKFRCYVRNPPSSDLFVFRQIFESKEYLPLIELIQKNNTSNENMLIVDAGANVGYTAVYLKLFFPEATLVAIEPDNNNAENIRLNLAINHITKTDVLVAGVWSHDCWLELKKDKSTGQEWAFYVVESPIPTSTRGIDILKLPQVIDNKMIDILKIDIEGSESKLFEDEVKISRLLAITKYIAIEIHDDMANREYIQRILNENNFIWFESGELTIASNQNLLNV
jgi:FkbM family methyltransferase